MTSYNREAYISEAIESVLASTYTNFELIIVDDVSKDNTVTIAKKFQELDNRIKVYVNEQNLGDYGNRNKAASYASGYYIMHVDSDDTIFPDGIEKCVHCMSLFPEGNFGMLNYYVKEATLAPSAQTIHNHFFKISTLGIGPGGTIIKRSFFEKINGFTAKYGPASDMYFNLKAVSQSPLVLLPFEFHHYRRHEGQEINNQYSYLYNTYAYLRDALKELDLFLTPIEIKWLRNKNDRRFFVNIVRFFFKSRDFVKTKEAIKKSGFGFRETLSAIFHL